MDKSRLKYFNSWVWAFGAMNIKALYGSKQWLYQMCINQINCNDTSKVFGIMESIRAHHEDHGSISVAQIFTIHFI